jgi:hypothetical protein
VLPVDAVAVTRVHYCWSTQTLCGCRGSFATVKRATSLDDGTDWAVKIIDKTKLAADDEAALKVEVEILQKVLSCAVKPFSGRLPS